MRIIDWSSDVCSSDLPNNHDSVPIDMWREEQVHPDDIARVEAAVTAHLEGRSEFYETEHRVRHRSAGLVWVSSRGMVVGRDSNGEPTRNAGNARDNSKDRRMARVR